MSTPDNKASVALPKGVTPIENAKPYANEGIRLTTQEGVVDLTPPAGAEFTLNFPGGFLFVTHEGCALGLNPLARYEAVKNWADPKFDRLICDFGGTQVAPVPDDIFERVRDRSLAWHPKGAYVIATRDGRFLRCRQDVSKNTCCVLDCDRRAEGPHPKVPPNTILLNLCKTHRNDVRHDPVCTWCERPAIVDLKATVDGLTAEEFDPNCLECAEKHTIHWRKNGVTWEKRAIRREGAARG